MQNSKETFWTHWNVFRLILCAVWAQCLQSDAPIQSWKRLGVAIGCGLRRTEEQERKMQHSDPLDASDDVTPRSSGSRTLGSTSAAWNWKHRLPCPKAKVRASPSCGQPVPRNRPVAVRWSLISVFLNCAHFGEINFNSKQQFWLKNSGKEVESLKWSFCLNFYCERNFCIFKFCGEVSSSSIWMESWALILSFPYCCWL